MFFSGLDWVMVLGEEDHRSKVSFSSCPIKGSYNLADSSLLILTLITQLSFCWALHVLSNPSGLEESHTGSRAFKEHMHSSLLSTEYLLTLFEILLHETCVSIPFIYEISHQI